jgi:hypothetical protein
MLATAQNNPENRKQVITRSGRGHPLRTVLSSVLVRKICSIGGFASCSFFIQLRRFYMCVFFGRGRGLLSLQSAVRVRNGV